MKASIKMLRHLSWKEKALREVETALNGQGTKVSIYVYDQLSRELLEPSWTAMKKQHVGPEYLDRWSGLKMAPCSF